jgi:ubiquinone/menaquinone biosynthesis C-methylase UbiE
MSMTHDTDRVCPVALANSLDNRLRRWLQDPRRILSPFVKEGMTALDVGCGPGFFTIELARLVGRSGRVIAADLQDGMLQRLAAKIRGTELEERIHLVTCDARSINVSEPIDFGLAFWMVHEVPDKALFFGQLKAIAKRTTQILVVEPKLFHVSRSEFEKTMGIAEDSGFIRMAGPRLLVSWSAVLTNA